MLKTIIIIVAVVIVGVLIFAATKPDTFRVQRAASIHFIKPFAAQYTVEFMLHALAERS